MADSPAASADEKAVSVDDFELAAPFRDRSDRILFYRSGRSLDSADNMPGRVYRCTIFYDGSHAQAIKQRTERGDRMNISPDAMVFWEWGFFKLNATIVFTWAVMAFLILVSWLVTRRLSIEPGYSRGQMFLESLVDIIRSQIKDVIRDDPLPYLPFIGTLFLFISVSNFFAFVPVYEPPTGSITTTAALAICVFFAVPVYGIAQTGMAAYFRHYIKPTVFMLPFNIISELSRTLALAVRLFGNVMSGTMIAALLLSVAPLFLPVIMEALSLLIGQIQAYIFAVLAAVYIASGTRAEKEQQQKMESKINEKEKEK